jgi:rfaE bifunctional protein nucleotidyltransferase chain/domain
MKVVSREEVVQERERWRQEGLLVGYTSGTFDLLHPGHTDYLSRAKEYCDRLIIGVNSDRSVQSYKGLTRPIVPAEGRAAVVAALRSADLVFIFDERNNNVNIELIKPDMYIKAGDYSRSELSSAPLVESYGGSVILVPIREGCSSTSIIQRIEARSGHAAVLCPPYEPRPAIFLDRDGTINRHVEYLHEPEKFELLDGVVDGLLLLQSLGFRLIITTNQPGIGMGYFTVEDFFAVNLKMLSMLSKAGILIDKIYFSPATKAEDSPDRKPAPGMILRAVKDLNVILERSWVIGDTTTDIRFAHNAGCCSILVTSGKDETEQLYSAEPTFKTSSLQEAAELIQGSLSPGNR